MRSRRTTPLLLSPLLVLVGCTIAADPEAYTHAGRSLDRDYTARSHAGNLLPIDPEVQDQFRELWARPVRHSERVRMMTEILYPPDKETGPAIRQEELARQVLFHVANLPRETHPRLVMAQFVRLARWLLGDLNPNSITAALEPYLDAEDPDLVAATQWLMYVGDVMKSDRGYRTEPAFGLVRDFYLRGDPGRSEDKLPTWVIEWMYKADPPAAMNTYLQAFGLGGSGGNAARARGSIGAVKHAQLRVENHVALKLAGALAMRPPQAGAPEAAAEVEPGTIEALRDLATTEQWWVRLYVVATMAKHLELRDPALLRRLAKDEHEYVRKAVAGIDDDERQP